MRNSNQVNKSAVHAATVGHEERPVWKPHARPIDDPHENFQRLRGQWIKPAKQMRKGAI